MSQGMCGAVASVLGLGEGLSAGRASRWLVVRARCVAARAGLHASARRGARPGHPPTLIICMSIIYARMGGAIFCCLVHVIMISLSFLIPSYLRTILNLNLILLRIGIKNTFESIQS